MNGNPYNLYTDVNTIFSLLKYMQQKNPELDKSNWEFVGVQISKDNWENHDFYSPSQCQDMQLDIRDYQNCAFYLRNISGEEPKIANVNNYLCFGRSSSVDINTEVPHSIFKIFFLDIHAKFQAATLTSILTLHRNSVIKKL